MPDGEIISCFIGQCGTQMSFACWELFCLEHGIRPDGVSDSVDNNSSGDGFTLDPTKAFFREVGKKKYIPRSVIMDTEPTVVDEIRTGVYRSLFSHESLITGLEDAANNFARGLYACATKVAPKTLQVLRNEVERTDNLQAILICHSFGGGTGAGTTCKILEAIDAEYSKTPKIELTVYPSHEMCTSVVEPYNAILCSSTADETADVTVLVDNQALTQICTNHLKIERPVFSHINRLLAQVTSGMTATVRYDSPLTASLSQIRTNLVPFPRLHYLQAAMAPFKPLECLAHEAISMHDLTASVFHPSNQLLTGDPGSTHVLACALLCRGDIAVQEIRNAGVKLKRKGIVNLVPWCPTGFKIGLTLQPPICIPQSGLAPVNRSVVGLYNSTLLVPPIQNVVTKAEYLIKKRAFVHWFLQEGLEEAEILEAHENVKQLIADFEEMDRFGVDSISSHGSVINQGQFQSLPKETFEIQHNEFPKINQDDFNQEALYSPSFEVNQAEDSTNNEDSDLEFH